MQVTMIGKDNIGLIMHTECRNRRQDVKFLNALWQYVLYSKNVSRIVPFCKTCHEHGKFTFEGLGGIKKVGDGMMYIPINVEELYIIPDIVFHYFYIHKVRPTKRFRDAVINESKPDSAQYIDQIELYYKPKIIYERGDIVCPCCGKIFYGSLGFTKGEGKDVTVFHKKFIKRLFNRDKSEKEELIRICYNCLHYVKV